MQHKSFQLIALLLLGIGLPCLHAQESTNSTGGNATGSGGSVSYSVGQVVYNTITGTEGSLTQGVQQPYEISEINGVEEVVDIHFFVLVYPNPSTDYLTLEMKTIEMSGFAYQLYDMNGKLLQNGEISALLTNIATGMLTPSTYFLKVVRNNMEVKTFKIIKN
ncbi:MAG: hypothetical protein A2W91_00750 [Bacteroidetes bacterium GWF2_38_335]|nr:MAG: hypothetical protein A2W91_00750 [Bacteroidetes bacterium GWF2_38_335]OFY78361.1 MAG: hypothetical protein A2281_04130 [Bacteroidetes bacterium RIFOXYA12_FULL_38_20]HBS87442.1 hypothetical protein [Bacteroidales bacterium]